MGRPRTIVNVGDRFGRLTIIEETAPEPRPEPSRSAYRRFRCRCDCGQETNARLCNMRHGSTTSCGCFAREKLREPKPYCPSPSRVPLAAGDRYGSLVVVREAEIERRPGQSPAYYRRVLCRCDCSKLVNVRLRNLRSEQTTSCGCSRMKKAG